MKVQSMQTKFKIMKQAVAKYLRVELKSLMKQCFNCWILAVCTVSLMCGDCFNHYFRLWIKPAEAVEAKAHNISDLKGACSGKIPLTRYIDLDVAFVGLKLPRITVLNAQNPNESLNLEYKTKLPCSMGKTW